MATSDVVRANPLVATTPGSGSGSHNNRHFGGAGASAGAGAGAGGVSKPVGADGDDSLLVAGVTERVRAMKDDDEEEEEEVHLSYV